jgi:hypothetical protein
MCTRRIQNSVSYITLWDIESLKKIINFDAFDIFSANEF